MLDKLRDRVVQILAETSLCTLATAGPAGLQASMVRCAGRGITLYLLVPDTSDHLFNLESESEVAITTETWRLRGMADIVHNTDVFSAEQRQWHTVVRVTPVRLHILPAQCGLANYAETIDFDG
jgi:hypothetical protein